ncbi:hypothetical protein Egran_00828 [Elaphomyces granulatus]|uniref:Uncharacterized protein n=1 Tax=Elaphomyces granulatus TaxID=519963 RepID=A0A232M4R8_9EURO|nr:hypothetical protein Egran_00828 [Elaphomyces granulatus]
MLSRNGVDEIIAVLFLLFIDGFGLYRNIYRALMGMFVLTAANNTGLYSKPHSNAFLHRLKQRHHCLLRRQCRPKSRTTSKPLLLSSRPNLHIGFHYAQAVEDHGTGANIAVWVGETKHKGSKGYIAHTNHLNAERDLLKREAEEQTLRVMINGGFRETEADRQVSDMVKER